MVKAVDKILELLENRGEDGVLQSEIPDLLDLSKSTVSDALNKLEKERKIVRREVTSKSYRIWLTTHYPNPLPGLLRVGILRASEYALLIISALNTGAIVKVFDDPIDLTRSLSQGKVDVAASPLLTQVIMSILMKNFKIFRLVAKNGSGIVINQKFKGNIYGTTEMSTMYRNLKRYAEIKNIKGKIIYFKSPTKMVESFVKGELAGIAIWEPYLTNLKNSGYRVDYFRDLIGDHFCCSIAINDETSRINRDALKKLISEYDDLCINGWISDEDITKVAEILEFDEDVVKKSLKNYIFCPELNLEEIISYLKDSGIDLSYESVLSVFEI